MCFIVFKDHFLFPLTLCWVRAMTTAFNELNDQRMNESYPWFGFWMLYVFRSLNWKYFDWHTRHFLFELFHGSNRIKWTKSIPKMYRKHWLNHLDWRATQVKWRCMCIFYYQSQMPKGKKLPKWVDIEHSTLVCVCVCLCWCDVIDTANRTFNDWIQGIHMDNFD